MRISNSHQALSAKAPSVLQGTAEFSVPEDGRAAGSEVKIHALLIHACALGSRVPQRLLKQDCAVNGILLYLKVLKAFIFPKSSQKVAQE